MAYSGSVPAKPVRASPEAKAVPPRVRLVHEDASGDTDPERGTSRKYPRAVRMLILIGGSALLWTAISHVVGVI